MIKIKKGLNIPISGTPEDKITDFKNPRSVALVGSDYHGLKPAMLVKEGEKVKICCSDKNNIDIYVYMAVSDWQAFWVPFQSLRERLSFAR